MLNIERGHHVDASIKNFQYILVAFGVFRTWNVCMSQFVNQGHLGVPRDDSIWIHLLERHPSILDFFARDDLQISYLRLCLRTAMRLHIADHHIRASPLAAMALVEHGIRLTCPCRSGQVDAQATSSTCIAGLSLHLGGKNRRDSKVAIPQAITTQQFFRVWPSLFPFALLFFVGYLLSHPVLPWSIH